jgi:hypothetical protein
VIMSSKARVQKPAPAFSGQAAMPDGTFEGSILPSVPFSVD